MHVVHIYKMQAHTFNLGIMRRDINYTSAKIKGLESQQALSNNYNIYLQVSFGKNQLIKILIYTIIQFKSYTERKLRF